MEDHHDDGFDEAYANSFLELSKSDYARVIFCDLSPYDEKLGVGCRFQITDNVHEDPCDYVGLYQVGWKNISQFIVLKLLTQIECEEDGKMLRCMFKGEEMPELKDGFYQFLYVTRDNEVCGASTPFEVNRIPKEESSDEDIVADNTEDDFLVVRSNIFEKNRRFEKKLTEMQSKIGILMLEKKELITIMGKAAEENKAKLQLKEKVIEKFELKEQELLAKFGKMVEENEVLKLKEEIIEELKLEKKELLEKIRKLVEENEDLIKSKRESIEKIELHMKELLDQIEENDALLNQKEKSIEKIELEKKELLAEVEKIAEENKVLLDLKESNAATIQTYSDQVTFLQSSLQTEKTANEQIEKGYKSLVDDNHVNLKEMEIKLNRAEKVIEKLQLHHPGPSKRLFCKEQHPDSRQQSPFYSDITYLEMMLKQSKAMLLASEESKQLAIEELRLLKAENSKPKSDHEQKVANFALELKLEDERIINKQLIEQCEQLNEKVVEGRTMINTQQELLEKYNLNEKKLLEKIHQISAMTIYDEGMETGVEDFNTTIYRLEQDILEKNATIGKIQDKINDLNTKRTLWEEEVFDLKSYCGELKQTIAKEEASSSKLKEECIKKEAVIEYLSKEKDQLLKKQVSLNEALNDMGARLKMAADLYREQYLKISALNKIIKSKSKVRHVNSIGSTMEEQTSSAQISDRPSCSASSTTSQNSDSDTGEHFQRATEKFVKVLKNEALTQSTEETRVVSSLSHLAQCNIPDRSGKLHQVSSQEPNPSFCKRDDAKEEALHQMIEQNLANLSASSPVPKYEDTESASKEYALPCSMCENMIDVSSNNTEAMVEHLEKVHQQEMCPICGCLFDMNMPDKYFQFHIDDHYNATEGKLE